MEPDEVEKIEPVSHADYGLAEQRWNEYWSLENEHRPYQRLHQFLGLQASDIYKTYEVDWSASKFKVLPIMLSESAARKIRMLCGPYYNAVLAKIRIEKLP